MYTMLAKPFYMEALEAQMQTQIIHNVPMNVMGEITNM